MLTLPLPPDLISWLIFMLLYHPISYLFHLFDTHNLFPRYKHSPATSTTPTYRQMLPRVVLNQIFILLPCMRLCTLLNLSYPQPPPLLPPSPLKSLLSLATLGPLFHEITFYIFHRYLLHSRFGLRTLNHALHHSSTTHSAISAMYMSSPDFFLEIVVPYLIPLIILSSFSLCSTWGCIALLPFGALGGMYEHSGYNFFENIPVLDTNVHALHHRVWNCSFADGVGALGIVDWGMGSCCVGVGKVLRKRISRDGQGGSTS